jgi:hypothetical protein
METLKEQEKHAKPDEKKRIDARMREHHEECERRKEKLQRSLDLAEETLAQVKGA